MNRTEMTMNPSPFRPIASSLAVSLVALAMTLPARAAPVDCAVPRGVDQQRACKAAAEGAESLRRFSERTRSIYQIYVHDYSSAVRPTLAAKDPDRVILAERR
jgi:hypothetical protein